MVTQTGVLTEDAWEVVIFGYTLVDCMCDMGEREIKWKKRVKINRIGKG